MEKRYSAKRYFILAFKKYTRNDYKVMAKKYKPSIREVLFDYIDIHEDINENKIHQQKLEKSREDLLRALSFFVQNNILYESIYKTELNILIEQINELEKLSQENKVLQYIKVYNTSKSILKKIDNDNIYSLIISLVKEYDSFIEMDRALECLINELLYDGYSLKYLDLWFNSNINTKEINEENINNILEKFTTLKRRQQRYKYYINVLDNGQITEEELFIDFNMILRKENYDQLTMIDHKTGEDVKNYLQKSSDYTVFSIEIEAMDIYKGLEMITNAVESYFQMIKYVSGQQKNILLDKVIGQYENHIFEKMRIESFDDKILFSSVENREREDIKDFIQYRNRIYQSQIKMDEIANLQRALNIVKNQQGQQQENRVINLWAVLEYILTFHDGLSIISKVREVIPKIISLYTIKDKLNGYLLNGVKSCT